MSTALLSKADPTLQLQLFLSLLFTLYKDTHHLKKSPSIYKIATLPTPTAPWIKEGILNRLLSIVTNLQALRPGEKLDALEAVLTKAMEESAKVISRKSTVENILRQCEPLAKLTADYLGSFPPNENLYFFLIRNQEKCHKVFGRVYLLNLFKKNHQGIKQTEQFIIERYHERGFTTFGPSIKAHIAGLTR
jgi:hypothetical protein